MKLARPGPVLIAVMPGFNLAALRAAISSHIPFKTATTFGYFAKLPEEAQPWLGDAIQPVCLFRTVDEVAKHMVDLARASCPRRTSLVTTAEVCTSLSAQLCTLRCPPADSIHSGSEHTGPFRVSEDLPPTEDLDSPTWIGRFSGG